MTSSCLGTLSSDKNCHLNSIPNVCVLSVDRHGNWEWRGMPRKIQIVIGQDRSMITVEVLKSLNRTIRVDFRMVSEGVTKFISASKCCFGPKYRRGSFVSTWRHPKVGKILGATGRQSQWQESYKKVGKGCWMKAHFLNLHCASWPGPSRCPI